MSSNVRKGSMTHRQLDVDQYDEDRYIEAEETENNSSALSDRQGRARQLLSSGQVDEALKVAISDPFYKGDQQLKVRISLPLFASHGRARAVAIRASAFMYLRVCSLSSSSTPYVHSCTYTLRASSFCATLFPKAQSLQAMGCRILLGACADLLLSRVHALTALLRFSCAG